METVVITLGPITSFWLNAAIAAQTKSMSVSIAPDSFQDLFKFGLVVGEPTACKPTAKAYAWKQDNEAAIRQEKAAKARKKKK